MVHKELLNKLNHNAKYYKNFNKEIENLFEFLEKKLGEEFNKYCNEYYQNNCARLQIDRREKRHISENLSSKYINQIEKELEKKQQIEKEILSRLEGKENIGIDTVTLKKRLINENEIIITVFQNGNCVKRQDPDGIHIILLKRKTLKFDPLSYSIDIIEPCNAESLDDSSPFTLFFFDSSGIKRDYKCNYSIRFCPSLYSYLSNLPLN